MSTFAKTPKPPYYSVLFTSQRTMADESGYQEMAERMVELAARQEGFLGVESVRGADGFGITISYWKSLEAIARWHENAEHRLAQQLGRSTWYAQFQLRISFVERDYGYLPEQGNGEE